MKASQSDMLAKLELSHIVPEEQAMKKAFVEKRIGNSSRKIEKRQLEIQSQMNVLLCGKL